MVTKKCTHEDCGYEWEYKGNLQRPTCPSCRRALKKQKND